MPGAKRRALKKLLSPNFSPSDHEAESPPVTASAASPINLPSASAAAPPVTHPDSYASPSKEQAILQDMQAREHLIGHQGNGRITHHELKSASAPPGTRNITADQLMDGDGGAGKKKSSKQRFLEREARKREQVLANSAPSDPHNDAKLEREKREEESVIHETCLELGVRIHEVPPDGHCMYYAIADQLAILGLLPRADATTPQPIRSAAASYLRLHADAFMPFVPSVLGEDMAGATDDGIMTPEGYQEYCRRVEESGDWGGEIEIQALARRFNVPIHVIQRGPPTIISHSPDDTGSGVMTAAQSLKEGKAVRISYHHRMYGLGEHYNSLRPAQH